LETESRDCGTGLEGGRRKSLAADVMWVTGLVSRMLTRGGSLSSIMVLSGIEEEWADDSITTLRCSHLRHRCHLRRCWTTRATLAGGWSARKMTTT
jgi:hypothetical protein